MYIIFIALLMALGFLFNSQIAYAAEVKDTPVVLSLFSPAQFPPEEYNTVRGLRTNILWGRHRSVYGLDLGIGVNQTDQDFAGFGIAVGLNITNGQTKIFGLQLAGLANFNNERADIYGVQAALINENYGNSKILGMQLGLANISDEGEIYGVQAGLYNSATEVHGLQVGVVNYTKNLFGAQIGLINFN
ncbi:MAG: LA_2272 family surface repeat-containing protein, partial [Pseudobdellovibrionaceae bacterium]